jgi:tripartite motif-containing protein 71
MGDFSTNGTSEAVHNSKNPWPLKPNATNLPGDQVTPNPWGTSLFDFSSFSPALAGSNGWQNLKGLNDSPWRNPQLNGHGHQQQQQQQQVQQPPGFPPGFEAIFCNSCEESNSKAIAYCQDCNEHICETCYHAHLRVKLTKDHKISMLASSESSSGKSAGGASSSSASSSSSVASSLAVKAPSKTTAIGDLGLSSPSGDFLATRSMQSEVLQVYQGAVEKAKSESKSLMNKASVGITQIDEATNHICETRSRVELKCNALRTEIMTIGQNYVLEVKKRQDLLVSRLEAIIKTKLSVLDGQATDLSKAKKSLKSMTEQLSLCTSQGHEMDLIKATNQANETLKDIQLICGNLMVHEDDNVFFTYPDPGLMKALSNFSFIGGSGYAPLSLADGDGLRKAILGKEAKFIVVVKDQLGEQRVAGGDDLRVSVVGPDGRIVRHSISDGQNGTYRVSWKPSVVGEHFINVTLKDMHVQKSPFRINVRMGRNYSTVSEPVKCFGSEGEADGQLCRPWGVCCTKTGLILVANRSNNRIDVYDKDGVFKYNFGTGGKLQGEFDRPASVCVDNLNRAVITDKDNHRIQVFSLKGT